MEQFPRYNVFNDQINTSIACFFSSVLHNRNHRLDPDFDYDESKTKTTESNCPHLTHLLTHRRHTHRWIAFLGRYETAPGRK